MNHYQQNNSLSVSTVIQVNFLNITYVNIINDSNIHKLISRLIVAQKEFQKCIDYKMSGSDTKSKAIELSSVLESLMDSIGEISYEKRLLFAQKIIESSCVVIAQYKEALVIEGFSENIVEDLESYTEKFYQTNFGKKVDACFWFKLKCYEWFLKEGFIERRSTYYSNTSEYSYIFNEETLEEFFCSNRKEVLNFMLKNTNEYQQVTFSSPLDEVETQQSYNLYMQISSLTKKA